MLVPTALAGLLLALAPAPQAGSSPQDQVAELLAAERADSQDERTALSESLAALGAAALPAMLDALRDEALGGTAGSEAIPLAPGATEALHGALAKLGRDSLVPVLRERIREDAPAPERAMAVEVLGRIGRAADLELLLEAAELARGERGPEPRLVRALESALPELLRRDPSRVRAARGLLLRAPPHTLAALARALACSGSPHAYGTLADALGASSDLDLALLPWLAVASGRDPAQPIEPRVEAHLAAAIQAPEAMLRRTAVLAAGHLEASPTVPLLIALLDGSDIPLSEAAHWSLVRITGLRFARERARWESWYAGEELWLRTEFPACVRALQAQPEQIVSALQEIGQHRLDRRRLAEAVCEVSDHPDSTVRAIACGVLGQLGTRLAVAALHERTRDGDPRVARRAEEALRTIARADPAGRPAATLTAPRSPQAQADVSVETPPAR